MSGGYVLIAGVLLYIFLLQKVGSSTISPIKAAAFFIISYYILYSIVMGIMYYTWRVPIVPNIFNSLIVFTALAQFACASVIFYKANEDSDDYVSYLLIGGFGMAIIFLVIPVLVQSLITAIW